MTNVLVIKPSSLGDIVHGLLVASSLRAQQPQAQIHWVARDVFAPLVRACPWMGRVHVFERHGGVRAFARLAREVRAARYDWVLDMQGLARSSLLAAAAGGARVVGRADAREGAGLLYRERAVWPPPAGGGHAVDILLGFLPVLGLEPKLIGKLEWEMPQGAWEWPESWGGEAPVVLFPGSRRPEKEWPFFAELTLDLLRRPGMPPVVWAGAEAQLLPEAALFPRFANLCGKTSLGDMLRLVREARAVVCNDSGPLHVAAAMGRPLVALFGPTDPRLYGPVPPCERSQRVLMAPTGRLADLGVGDVLEALLGLLDSSPGSAIPL